MTKPSAAPPRYWGFYSAAAVNAKVTGTNFYELLEGGEVEVTVFENDEGADGYHWNDKVNVGELRVVRHHPEGMREPYYFPKYLRAGLPKPPAPLCLSTAPPHHQPMRDGICPLCEQRDMPRGKTTHGFVTIDGKSVLQWYRDSDGNKVRVPQDA